MFMFMHKLHAKIYLKVDFGITRPGTKFRKTLSLLAMLFPPPPGV